MHSISISFSILLLLNFSQAFAYSEPDWSEGANVPAGGRANIYELDESELATAERNGRLHALNYPVTDSGLLLPFRAVESFFDGKGGGLWKTLVRSLFKITQGYDDFDDLQEWMGLHKYPIEDSEEVPHLNSDSINYRMGITKIRTTDGDALSVSCAQCHSENLFGTKIVGLTNRRSRANEFFMKGKSAFRLATPGRFRWMTNASDGEVKLFERSYHSMKFVGLKKPIAFGLDTSLAQVSLSLARRAKDPYASRDLVYASHPRSEPLSRNPADSKPAVWWTLKYKNRWLSDGSLVSGNPIFTNFLWNEIGRGTDLYELEAWLENNSEVIEDLTTAVFATKAPSYFDFFAASDFDIESAKRGEKLFEAMCMKCHGRYEKNWSRPGSGSWPLKKQMSTFLVTPREQTRVFKVGTDSYRAEGMKSLVQLNDLAISKKYGIHIEPQEGYVAPPLNGIWARWPYFHNNSAATLCDVLTPGKNRPDFYFVQDSVDRERDFDQDCNGYPRQSLNRRTRNSERLVRLGSKGLSKLGHDERIFVFDGQNSLTRESRKDLIRFLQTL